MVLVDLEVTVSPGGFSAAAAEHLVHGHLDTIRNCYARALAQSATLQGDVDLTLHVAPDGLVVRSVIEASTLETDRHTVVVARCCSQEARRWRFPAEETRVQVRLRLRPPPRAGPPTTGRGREAPPSP